MEVSSQLVSISSLVPLSSLRPMNTLARKYWHVICKAEFYIPCGVHVVRLIIFLVSFELRLFLNIAFEILFSLPECMENVSFPSFAELSSEVAQPSLMLPSASIPLACGSFELPSCARCFLGFSCQTHKKGLQ